MKAYRVTFVVIDHDHLGADGIQAVAENTRYPNHCLRPRVTEIEEAEIGEWSDDHPLNQIGADMDAPFEHEGDA